MEISWHTKFVDKTDFEYYSFKIDDLNWMFVFMGDKYKQII